MCSLKKSRGPQSFFTDVPRIVWRMLRLRGDCGGWMLLLGGSRQWEATQRCERGESEETESVSQREVKFLVTHAVVMRERNDRLLSAQHVPTWLI